MNNKNKSVGYGSRGWILIIACIFTNYMLAAATGDSLNILALRFEENFSWSQASVFLLASYGMFIAAVVSILFSFLLKKLKDSARKIMIIALVITVVGVVLWGYCTKFWQFAVLFTIVNIAVNIICYYGANPLINNWFPKKKGSAIGIATTGMNAASFSIVWILMLGWNLMGWHGGFYIFAFLAFIPLVLIVFFVKEYPEQCGAFPDNDKTMTREEAEKLMGMEELYDKTSYFTVKNSLKCKQMWQIALSCGFTMACTGIIYQFIPACIDRGFTETQGIVILTITGIMAIPFSVLLGIFDQKKGAKKADRHDCRSAKAARSIFVCQFGDALRHRSYGAFYRRLPYKAARRLACQWNTYAPLRTFRSCGDIHSPAPYYHRLLLAKGRR